MRGITTAGIYLPYWQLDRAAIAAFHGGRAKGRRSVAAFDEDAVTLAVRAGRTARAVEHLPSAMTFVTTSPPALEKSYGATVAAGLRLDAALGVLDAVGAVRAGASAVVDAFESRRTTLVAASDLRFGMANSADELNGGDAGAAVVIGDGDESTLIAEYLDSASITEEYVDRWRVPGEIRTRQWEERFGENRSASCGAAAINAVLAQAGVAPDEVAHVGVAAAHPRAATQALKQTGVGAPVVDLSDGVGNAGAAQFLLSLVGALEVAEPGQLVLGISLWDGADAVLMRRCAGELPGPGLGAQLGGAHGSLSYRQMLNWRGVLPVQPPNRPEPARQSSPAASRRADWKYGFVGTVDEAGNVALPPTRADADGDRFDHTNPVSMADERGTITTFTVDRLAYSPSPPVIFAVVDFPNGGRVPIELCDCSPEEVAIGDEVELEFRRLSVSDGISNYFWKARLVR
jgi:hydroxymethylglutaryl-CoA synthase